MLDKFVYFIHLLNFDNFINYYKILRIEIFKILLSDIIRSVEFLIRHYLQQLYLIFI